MSQTIYWKHIRPDDDWIEHRDDDCPCKPTYDWDKHIVIHNAVDERTNIE